MRLGRRGSSSRGQGMVELSLVAPVLLLLLIGLSDIPRAVFDYNVISNAAREGAREGVLVYNQCRNTAPCTTPPSGSSLVGVQHAITRAAAGTLGYTFNETSSANPTAPSCTLTANHGCVWVFVVGGNTTTGCTPPNPVSAGGTDAWSLCDFNSNKRGGNNLVVEVEYDFAPLTPLVSKAFGNFTILWAKSEMKTEY